MKNLLTKRVLTLGVASMLAVGALTGCSSAPTPEVTTPPTTETPAPTTPQATSPMGDRKMIDVDGNRYVFLNNGQAFELTSDQLGAEVATQNDGKLLELADYNKDFRMAFEKDGQYYICENVGKSDDSAMDVAAYLEAANLEQHVVSGDIFDHMGGTILKSLTKEDTTTILNAFANAKVAELTTEQHEAIAKAQSEGLSYKVEFMLEDNTTFTSYVIPSMNYITIGDYTCIVEGLNEAIGSYFEGLVASENISMN